MASPSVTQALLDLSGGNREALERLLPLVYDHLRDIANRALRGERPDHTLNSTALVHEAWLRLVELDRITWRDRAHFFGACAQIMRRVLISHARSRGAEKRGGPEARQARVVECRFFAGMSVEDTAEVIGISPATVKREWTVARAWLNQELAG